MPAIESQVVVLSSSICAKEGILFSINICTEKFLFLGLFGVTMHSLASCTPYNYMQLHGRLNDVGAAVLRCRGAAGRREGWDGCDIRAARGEPSTSANNLNTSNHYEYSPLIKHFSFFFF